MSSSYRRWASPLCALLLPAFAFAQEPAEETPAPVPPADVAEAAGEWWARLGDSAFQAQALAALINIAAIIIISAIVYYGALAIVGSAIQRMEQQAGTLAHRRRSHQRVLTVLELVRSIIRTVILVTAGIWILASAGMDIRPILAGAGVIGLAVGFGARNLVRDIVSGFFILLEGQYAVGDYIRVGVTFGMVEAIGLRSTVLKDLNNQRHYIPNGTVALVTVYDDPFTNHVIEVPLADGAQCQEATRVIARVAEQMQQEYSRYIIYYEAPEPIRCDEDTRVRLPVAIFPSQEWLATDEIPATIKDALAAAEIPLREGRTIRAYTDLSRMPEYRYADGEEEVA